MAERDSLFRSEFSPPLRIKTWNSLQPAFGACGAPKPMRSLVRETHLHPGALIYPLFLCPGEGVRREVNSMPGVYNLSIDEAVKEAEEAAPLGLGGLLLFGLPESRTKRAAAPGPKTASCSRRCAPSSRQPKKLLLIADVCLCEYTSHGHCGVVQQERRRVRSR